MLKLPRVPRLLASLSRIPALRECQGTCERLDNRAMLAADLAVSITENLPQFVVPGDRLTFTATVSNQGDAPARGPVTVRFLAPSIDAEDPIGVVASVTRNISLRPGQTTVLTARWTANANASPGQHNFGALLEADPSINESTENDSSISEGGFDLKYLFGSYGDRRNVTLTMSDDDGSQIVYSLRGGGYGEFRPAETDDEIAGLDIIGTGSADQFSIAVKGGDRIANLSNNINITGSLRKFDAKAVNFTGSIIAGGSITDFVARDLTDLDFTLAGVGAPMKFKAGTVTNLRLESSTPIAQLDVTSWSWLTAEEGDDRAENELSTLTAPWVGRITTRGEFSAITSLSGEGAPGLTLNQARIGGAFSGQMAVVGNTGTFQASSMDQGLLVTSGSIATVNVTSAINGSVWANSIVKLDLGTVTSFDAGVGAMFTSTALPGLADGNAQLIAWGGGTIGSINVKGNITTARFAAGVNPVNGTFLDEDDITSATGVIGRIDIRGTPGDVLFAATTLPATARLGALNIRTTEDDRFLLLDLSDTGV
jgi:uncharacterized repeat protein (TIGR01451 family)